MSYWPEMKSRYCGGSCNIVADKKVKEINVSRSVIKGRKSKYYESCWWAVTAPEKRYADGSKLKISILNQVRGSFFVY